MAQELTSGGADLSALTRQLSGAVQSPGDSQFELARRVWNAAIDRRPAAIAICVDAEDVAVAVRFAAERDAGVTVRGGGHNVAGRSVVDGALLIDLSRMRDVEVNTESQIATVQGGALWHDVDVATARLGLATTGGMVSSTGVGGFTVGGGTGWLMRRHGLAIDNLMAAGVVLPDGRYVRACAQAHEELFYGLRGGAGGLGVVTSFEFKLHPLRQVLAGVIIRSPRDAAAVLRTFRDFALEAPDDYCGMVVLSRAPPLPFLDAAWHGRPVCISAVCWCGDIVAGERALEPVRRGGAVLADHVGPMSYVQWQHLQDASAPAGRYHYWKTTSYADLTGAAIDVLAQAIDELASPLTEIHVQHLGGAVARVPETDTAFCGRSAQFFVNLIGATAWAAELPIVTERIRSLNARLVPHALPDLLPNFSNEDDGDPGARFVGEHGGRLAALRRRYDPDGLFAGSPAKS